MKNIKRYSLIVMTMVMLLIMTACGGKTEKVVYSADLNGSKLTTTLEYDKDKNVKKSTTEATVNYATTGQGKDYWQSLEAVQNETYSEMKGTEYKAEVGEEELTYTIVLDFDKIEKGKKESLFGTAIEKDGNIKLENMVKQLEAIGLKKE